MEPVLDFLKVLEKNNNRDWFTENKKRYQESLELFRGFIEKLLAGIVEFDPSLGNVVAKDTIFRIYKDVRFSRDKSPYKTNFGSWMARGGRKSDDAGYYFNLEPDNTFVAAGVHKPPKETLDLIRQEIIFHPDAYLEIINDPGIADNYERGGKEDMLKKGPAGFPEDFEYMDELKYRHYIFSKHYDRGEVLKAGFSGRVIDDFRGLYPLVEYLNHAMSFAGNE